MERDEHLQEVLLCTEVIMSNCLTACHHLFPHGRGRAQAVSWTRSFSVDYSELRSRQKIALLGIASLVHSLLSTQAWGWLSTLWYQKVGVSTGGCFPARSVLHRSLWSMEIYGAEPGRWCSSSFHGHLLVTICTTCWCPISWWQGFHLLEREFRHPVHMQALKFNELDLTPHMCNSTTKE